MNEPQQHCADKLLLVAEMLQAAAEYLTTCRTLLDDEDQLMSRLAYEQALNLRNRVALVNKKVDELEAELRRRIADSCAENAPARSKRAGRGAV